MLDKPPTNAVCVQYLLWHLSTH